jgi:type IV pilus assembly protein PilW
MNSNAVIFRYQRGITLVELMIGMVIGLILMSAVFNIFLSSKRAYRTTEELGRIQENARYALQTLTKDLRMVNYMGCFGEVNKTDNVIDSKKPIDTGVSYFDNPITGYDAQSNTGTGTSDWTPNLPSYFSSGQSIAGSDILVIQRAVPFSTPEIGSLNMTTSSGPIEIGSNPPSSDTIKARDTLVISDCEDSDIFMVDDNFDGTSVPVNISHNSTVNTSNSLSTSYPPNAKLMRMVMNGYYVGTNTDGNRALYRTHLANDGAMDNEELVEGVETMQVSYGEDTDSDGLPNRYVSAGDVTDTDDIVTVRVGLLMYSVREVSEENDTRSFNVAGTNVDDTGTIPTHGVDKSLRQVYTATVKIRNRGMQ